MIKKISLAAGVAALFGLPVNAYNAATIMLNNKVLDAVKQTGTSILIDTQLCQRNKEMMGHYLLTDKVDALTICSKAHDGSVAELLDTIRHEAVHVAQSCNGDRPIFKLSTLLPHISQTKLDFIRETYNPEDHHHEIEAFTVAGDQTDDYVIDLIEEHCYEQS